MAGEMSLLQRPVRPYLPSPPENFLTVTAPLLHSQIARVIAGFSR